MQDFSLLLFQTKCLVYELVALGAYGKKKFPKRTQDPMKIGSLVPQIYSFKTNNWHNSTRGNLIFIIFIREYAGPTYIYYFLVKKSFSFDKLRISDPYSCYCRPHAISSKYNGPTTQHDVFKETLLQMAHASLLITDFFYLVRK